MIFMTNRLYCVGRPYVAGPAPTAYRRWFPGSIDPESIRLFDRADIQVKLKGSLQCTPTTAFTPAQLPLFSVPAAGFVLREPRDFETISRSRH